MSDQVQEAERVHCTTHGVGWDPDKLTTCWYEDGRAHHVLKGDLPQVRLSSVMT